MIEGELLEQRAIVWNKESFSELEESGYGKNIENRLELDLIEALYLLEKEKIKVYKKEGKKKKFIDFKELLEYGSATQKDFHPIFVVYRDLRERGFLPKTGLKFGCSLRCYDRGVKLKKGPKAPHEHTKWVIHVIPEEFTCSFAELSRAVRLAQNIRTNMLWAIVDRENDITFYEVKRITP